MGIENYYIGGNEFIIKFRDGVHELYNVDDDAVIYKGHYDECKTHLWCMSEEYKINSL